MLPPGIPDFTPQPSGPLPHLQGPGGTLLLSPRDSPELGLLELVAAGDVLENVVELQGARRTFTTRPLLYRDVFGKQMLLPAKTRALWPPLGPPPSPCHARQRPPHGFSPGHGKRLRTEPKQELQTTCPKANIKSHHRDALIILTIVMFIFLLSFRRKKVCFLLSRAVRAHRAPPFRSLADTRSAWLSPSPTPSPPPAQAPTFSSTSLRSCSHSRVSGFTRFCVKSRVSLRDSP